MVSKETGILPGSDYYFFTQSETTKKYYYHLIWCGHYYCRAGYSINRNYYPHMLIAYIKKGEMNLIYNNHNYIVKEGTILLIDCQFPHHYTSNNGLEFSYFHFDGVNSHEFSRYLIKENKSPIFQTSQNTKIGKIINETIGKYRHGELISKEESSKTIHNILCSLTVKKKADTTTTIVINQSIDFIKENIQKKITLLDISHSVNLSPYYFAHLFKQNTGFSPLEYAMKYRMDLAVSLLKTTTQSVGEIAQNLGYSSDSSFINTFSKKIGISPNRFRKMPL